VEQCGVTGVAWVVLWYCGTVNQMLCCRDVVVWAKTERQVWPKHVQRRGSKLIGKAIARAKVAKSGRAYRLDENPTALDHLKTWRRP
jgi:hypothetical protein